MNLHPDDCDRSLKGIYLAEAAYEDGEVGIQAYLSGKSELADYELLAVYDGGAAGGQVFMAISRESGAEVCHVSFKGSSDLVDWTQDLSSINLTDCPASDGTSMGQCGAGFIDQYAALRDAGAVQKVLDGLDNSCDGDLYIYGHSLGGAEASILTAELLTLRPGDAERIHTYTYGEPRTFATADGDAYQDESHKVRWMHWGDPVPSLPPTSSGFEHFGDARELTSHWFGDYYITQQKQDAAIYSPDPSNHYTASYIENLKACK